MTIPEEYYEDSVIHWAEENNDFTKIPIDIFNDRYYSEITNEDINNWLDQKARDQIRKERFSRVLSNCLETIRNKNKDKYIDKIIIPANFYDILVQYRDIFVRTGKKGDRDYICGHLYGYPVSVDDKIGDNIIFEYGDKNDRKNKIY